MRAKLRPGDGGLRAADAAWARLDEPALAQEHTRLVTVIRVTGSEHVGMRAVLVDYHVGAKKYRWHNLISLQVETKKKQCS